MVTTCARGSQLLNVNRDHSDQSWIGRAFRPTRMTTLPIMCVTDGDLLTVVARDGAAPESLRFKKYPKRMFARLLRAWDRFAGMQDRWWSNQVERFIG